MLKNKSLFSLVIVALLMFGAISTASAAKLEAPDGKARLIFNNRSFVDMTTTLNVRSDYSPDMKHAPGKGFEGGEEFVIGAGEELVLDLEPGYYVTEWTAWDIKDAPNGRDNGFGPDLVVSAGDVIVVWSKPEYRQAFMEINGSQPIQVK